MECRCLSLVFLLSFSHPGLSFSDTVDDVKMILSKVNIDMSRHSLSEVPFQDHRIYIPLILDVGVKEGSVGKLCTFVVRRETDQHIQNHTASDGSTNYEFDVSVGLEDIHFRYSFFFSYLIIFSTSGTITVEARRNTIQLKGTVTLRSDGSCSSELAAASFTDLADYNMSIEPDGFMNTFWGFLGDIIDNYIIDSFIYSLADKYLQKSIKNPTFKENFSMILCESLVQ